MQKNYLINYSYMKNQEVLLESKTSKIWLVLVIRWLFGGLLAFVISLLILISNVVIGPTLVAKIFAGQLLAIINFLFNTFTPTNINGNIINWIFSLLIYFGIWFGIGGLLASGRKYQIIFGGTLFIVYIIIGYSMSKQVTLPGMS